jgi:zinc transporter ZupT
MVLSAYLLLFITTIAFGGLAFVFNKKEKVLKYISVFGGAFLFAVCFVNLLPNVFEDPQISSLLLSVFILMGFLLQLFLELISKGAEHGHLHKHAHSHHNNAFLTALMVLIGVSIHAFFEGFALIGKQGVNMSLLLGVIIHNIPVAIIVVSGFIQSNCSKRKSLFMLSIFAIMGVLGSLLSQYIIALKEYQNIVIAFVVGILLHVSLSTLFDSEESHRYNFLRFLIVIIAFVIVCLLPH